MAEETKKPAAKKPAAPKAPKAEAPKAEKASSKKTGKGNAQANITPRLKTKYENEVKKALLETYKYKSTMEIPALNKIVINIGVGDATSDAKRLDEAVQELGQITGQKPVTTRAKKSVASFKLREGQAIGCKVTLRGVRMYDFFDKLVSIALPRVRDFRGVSRNAFDGRGHGLDHYFDALYLSYEMGIMKPERRIFEMMLQGEQAKPDETVFIDDSAHNTQAAAALGIHVLQPDNGGDWHGMLESLIARCNNLE